MYHSKELASEFREERERERERISAGFFSVVCVFCVACVVWCVRVVCVCMCVCVCAHARDPNLCTHMCA